mgnify:CR=1 FL=1
MSRLQHRITKIRPDQKIADCSVCGPKTRIQKSGKKKNGDQNFRCAFGVKNVQSRYNHNNEKLCIKCNEYKDPNEFFKDSSRPDGLRYCCKICLDKPTPKEYKKYYVKRKYGIDWEFYLSKTSCDICNRKFKSSKREPHIDHCHETGDVRGFLCNNCNIGLGHFKDNKNFLAKAIDYLG